MYIIIIRISYVYYKFFHKFLSNLPGTSVHARVVVFQFMAILYSAGSHKCPYDT